MESHVIKLGGVSMVLPESEAANFLSYDMDKSIKLWENFAISNVLCRVCRVISWLIIVSRDINNNE